MVVDNTALTDVETGEISSVAMAPEAIDRLTALVRDAVGYDPARGDRVNVINTAFLAKEQVELPLYEEPPIWQQPDFVNYAKQAIGGLFILVLVFGVLRPVMRSLTDSAKEVREMEAQQALESMGGELGGDLSDETVTLSGGDSILLTGPNGGYEQQLNAVKGLIAEDPGRVAQVVKKWVAAGE